MKVHDQGEQIMPHARNLCENRFVTKSAWRTHMRKVHEMIVTTNSENVENIQV